MQLTRSAVRRLAVLSAVLAFAHIPRLGAQEEMKKLTARLLAPPTLKPEVGFSTRLIVPPGNLYDPVWMLSHRDAIWFNDDGGEEEGKGSRLLTVNDRGRFSVMAGIGKMLPVTGFDFAAATFGSYGGQIFTLA